MLTRHQCHLMKWYSIQIMWTATLPFKDLLLNLLLANHLYFIPGKEYLIAVPSINTQHVWAMCHFRYCRSLVQIMACRWTVASHHLNLCWLGSLGKKSMEHKSQSTHFVSWKFIICIVYRVNRFLSSKCNFPTARLAKIGSLWYLMMPRCPSDNVHVRHSYSFMPSLTVNLSNIICYHYRGMVE